MKTKKAKSASAGVSLLACPFCGSDAVFSLEEDIDDGVKLFSAGCRNCLIYTPWDTSVLHAAEVWNKRTKIGRTKNIISHMLANDPRRPALKAAIKRKHGGNW